MKKLYVRVTCNNPYMLSDYKYILTEAKDLIETLETVQSDLQYCIEDDDVDGTEIKLEYMVMTEKEHSDYCQLHKIQDV